MGLDDLADRQWRRSGLCNGGNCLEIAMLGDLVKVRNSADQNGPVLSFGRDAWGAFLALIRCGGLEVRPAAPGLPPGAS